MAIHTATKFYPEVLLHYFINFGKAFCLLPLNSGSTITLKVLNGVGCFVVTTNLIGILLSLLSTIYINFHDKILVTELLCFLMVFLKLFLNILFWRFKRLKFQEFLQEFRNFLTSKTHERLITNKYLNHYKYFYAFLISFASGAVLIRTIYVPTQLPQKIPFTFYYPFVIEPYSATYYIIYLSQSIASFYCGYQIIFPIIAAMIFKHAAIKLEVLVYDLKRVKNYSQLKTWIQQHLECIWFVDRVNRVQGGLVMKSYILLGLATIFGSIEFIYNPDFFTIVRAFPRIISCLIATYIYNGPADDIYEMNQIIGFTLYDMEWNDELIEMRKTIIIIMSRIQKPLLISPLKELMPALTRKVYTNFLSYLISYIMTLRALVSSQ